MGAGKRGGGLGTTLVLAFVIVVLSVALGVGISSLDFMARLPVVGPFLFEERPEQTTTGRSWWRASRTSTSSPRCAGKSP